jgi:glutathione S-transferase
MFIAEKGLEIETRDISIARGEQMEQEFKAINPRATLPALITDEGTLLGENLGIAAYLEARFPEPPLMGRTAEEKGQVLTWNAIAEHQGGMPVAEALRNSNPHFKHRALPGPDDIEQIPALAERGLKRIGLFFDLLDERLKESPFLACDHFTLADISAFVFTDFARVVKMRLPETHLAARSWFENVKARPSAQR